ncbi:hypothetical protein [Streptomyces sp. NBC_00986]|uniref:hypothetical protein n=1 Tax=Streptomyces sp. NBC_00986 TaxID=2903702 RepID=UPI00386856F5|nr:hypothetical protein OG504_44585 [Streptomyces sp. NBC_00986]
MTDPCALRPVAEDEFEMVSWTEYEGRWRTAAAPADRSGSLAATVLVQGLRLGVLVGATTAFRADREPFYPGGRVFPAY